MHIDILNAMGNDITRSFDQSSHAASTLLDQMTRFREQYSPEILHTPVYIKGTEMLSQLLNSVVGDSAPS